ncbi:hypothetical protein EYF80_050858 [Liparis tanakae]|uniref:Uncharacterized protein n=1 Tax=Liparis tanakae TaxID=230148 RepID=A0A4Z2FEZ2_9TELE|nr:hypothetical protein EYF80_050858 [Liparis tanakae]
MQIRVGGNESSLTCVSSFFIPTFACVYPSGTIHSINRGLSAPHGGYSISTLPPDRETNRTLKQLKSSAALRGTANSGKGQRSSTAQDAEVERGADLSQESKSSSVPRGGPPSTYRYDAEDAGCHCARSHWDGQRSGGSRTKEIGCVWEQKKMDENKLKEEKRSMRDVSRAAMMLVWPTVNVSLTPLF